jgi:hypothetical protein
MIDFSLNRILEDSPYGITLSGTGFIFKTDYGIHYRVSFDKEDIILGNCETYQLILQNVENVRMPHDPKVELTVLAIIYEFFRSNQHVLLYICDTSDGKESSRNRLFLYWFEKHAEPNRFTICTAHAQIEDEVVYAAIIVDNRNPRVNEITADFEKTSSLLADKP